MPVIHVEMFKGRPREVKRALAKELTDAYIRVVGGKPEGVTIILNEVDREDWAVAGQLVVDRTAG